MSEKRLYVVEEKVVQTAVVKVGWVDLADFVKSVAGEDSEASLTRIGEEGDLEGWLEEHQEEVASYVADNQVLYDTLFETWHSGDPGVVAGETTWYDDLEMAAANIQWSDFDYGDYKGAWMSLNDYAQQNKEETKGLGREELGRRWLESGMKEYFPSWTPRIDLRDADPENIIPPTGYKLVKEE